MNIRIKLTCLIGLVIAPILGGHLETRVAEQEVQVEMNVEPTDLAQAVITYSVTENGETVTEEKIFNGTQEQVKAQLEAFEKTTQSDENDKKVVIEKIDIKK